MGFYLLCGKETHFELYQDLCVRSKLKEEATEKQKAFLERFLQRRNVTSLSIRIMLEILFSAAGIYIV